MATRSKRPFSLEPERIVRTPEDWSHDMALRCAERNVSLSQTRTLPGVTWFNLHDMIKGKFKDTRTKNLMDLADALGLEVVLRLKSRRPKKAAEPVDDDLDETHIMSVQEWAEIRHIWAVFKKQKLQEAKDRQATQDAG